MKKKVTGILILLLIVIAGAIAVLLYRINEKAGQAVFEENKTEETADSAVLPTETPVPTVTPEPTPTAAPTATPEPTGMLSGTEGMEDLKMQIEGMTGGWEGDWSVYVKRLDTREYMESNSHQVKAASLIKLYIMGAVLEQVQAGTLTEDDTIDTLLNQMITVSDNESSNELVRRLSPDGTNHDEGMKVVNAFAQEYGFTDTSQGRDLRDYREVPAEGENYTSVKDCGAFLEHVYNGTCVSAEASAQMLELLKQQTRTWKIPAGVPSGVTTANKTGELSDTENDVAIVYSPACDYILCVTSAGLSDTSTAQQNIVSISSTVYQYLNS